MKFRKMINNAKKGIAIGLISFFPFLTSCDKIKKPLGLVIDSIVNTSKEVNYREDTLETTIIPTAKPYEGVRVKVYSPDSPNEKEWEELSDNGAGKHIKRIIADKTGIYSLSIQVKTADSWNDQDTFPHFNVFMNEQDIDSALPGVVEEIGVNRNDLSTVPENEITDYHINHNSQGYETDCFLFVKKNSKQGVYHIDIQGLENDSKNFTKKTFVNSIKEGYKHSEPVMTKDQIKKVISDEKSAGWPDLNPQNITYTITKSQGLKFSGENIFSTISFSDDVERVENAVKEPNQAYSAYEEAIKTGNEYKKEIITSNFGQYSFKFRYKERDIFQFVDIPEETVPVNMNEQQSDDVLYNKCFSLKVSSATATNGQIIDVQKNLNHGFGGTMYNNDVEITVRDSTVGGNIRDYVIDVQGSESDTYNSTKEADAKASAISYKHLSKDYTLSNSDLENKIQELNDAGWLKTF